MERKIRTIFRKFDDLEECFASLKFTKKQKRLMPTHAVNISRRNIARGVTACML